MSTVAAPTVIVPLTIVVPLATAALLAGANRQLPAAARDVLAVGAATVTTVLAAVALAISTHGRIVYWFGGWHPIRGTVIGVDYVVDPMGGALSFLAGVLAVAALVYPVASTTGGRYPALVLVSTNPTTATSSNATNMLNRSPVQAKSTLAATKTSTRAG